MKKIIILVVFCLVLAACQPAGNELTNTSKLGSSIPASNDLQPNVKVINEPPTPAPYPNLPVGSTATAQPVEPGSSNAAGQQTPVSTNSAAGKIPNFDHIVLIVLENEAYDQVIGSPQMPFLNALATQNVLLSNYYAISHPSLPNYIALMSGGTQGITSDCNTCFVNQNNLADEISTSGRTWKSYEENMPSPCFLGDAKLYAQKHNPLIYFDSIRLNSAVCDNNIVPLTQLDNDLAAKQLPNFSFVMPNLCNSGHDCTPDKSDAWVQGMVAKLQASPSFGNNSLIAIIYDESVSKDKGSCCGLGSGGGGKVAAILISPLARKGFTDSTEYSHYSLLKTILTAWNLPGLGMSEDPSTSVIVAPWLEK